MNTQPLRHCLWAALFLAACEGGSAVQPAPGPVALERVSRPHQNGVVGGELAEPLRVRVLGSDGKPMANAQVEWSIPSGAGSLVPLVSISDGAGISRVRWTLPAEVGLYQAVAAVEGLPRVVFSAAGLASPGADRGGPRLDLASFAFLPDSIARSASSPSTIVRTRITDDHAGVAEATVILVSPSGAPHVRTAFRRVSGDDRDGIYHATVEFDAGLEPGQWFVYYVTTRDRLGQEEHYGRPAFARFPLQVGG